MDVELRGLGKSYDGTGWAVRGVDLTVRSGSIVGLIGPNGAGKSTALRMVATVMEPSEGSIVYGGRLPGDGAEQQALRRRIGFLGDGNPLYKQLSPREYLRFFGQCFRMPAAELERATEEILDTFSLTPKADTPAGELSKGMRQRLLIARCLLHRPELLILDEPADGLDPRGRSDLRRIIADVRARGVTVIISSHILRELDDLCDEVAIIQRGQVVVAGPVNEIIQRYEVARFVYQLRLLPEGAALAPAVLARHRALVEAEGTVEGLPSITLQWQRDEAAMAELLAELYASGVRVVTCSRVRSRLEDVYDRISEDRVN
ncbi:MAG: ABC transporter ATP-binding protein [Deltaproteobacteria bacterium]|nr:ABC transporter ATP-binding protein [Nannocystaceae bacterium]